MSIESEDLLKIVVVGGSGFGRECLDTLEEIKRFGGAIEIVGVLDDAPSDENLERISARQIEYLGTLESWLAKPQLDILFVVGIGNPIVRETVAERLTSVGLRPYTAIHPTAQIGSRVSISEGAVICAGAVISTNVSIGSYGHLNPGVIIGHDSELCSYVSINPGAVISGEVLIKNNTLVGAGAIVLQGLEVGENVILGAASLITKDVPSGVVVKGIPGRWKE